MPCWVAMVIGAASVFAFEIFKALLKKGNMKPIVLNVCSFALTMALAVIVAYAIRYAFFTPIWE